MRACDIDMWKLTRDSSGLIIISFGCKMASVVCGINSAIVLMFVRLVDSILNICNLKLYEFVIILYFVPLL